MGVFCLSMCLCTAGVPSACRGQKRVSTPLKLKLVGGCELLSGCWKLNPGPLQEQQMLLTASPLQPSFLFIFCSMLSKNICVHRMSLPTVSSGTWVILCLSSSNRCYSEHGTSDVSGKTLTSRPLGLCAEAGLLNNTAGLFLTF